MGMPETTPRPAQPALSAPQKALRKMGLVRPVDLALHLPYRYEDETRLTRIADANRAYADKAEGAKAETGDRVTVSFKGTIDGVAFDGGTGEDIPVVIGSASFIPGFEDQLVGIAVGETRTIKVTFPTNYASETLAGKPAEFETTATKVEAPQAVTVDDEFAKTLGMESLDKLKEAAKGRLAAEYAGAARLKVKRALLDRLDEPGPHLRRLGAADDEPVDDDLDGRSV